MRYGRPEAGKWHLDPAFTLSLGPKLVTTELGLTKPSTELAGGGGGSAVPAVEGLTVIPRMPVVYPSPLSIPTRSAVIKQVQECKAQHGHSRTQERYVPDRLVDLGPPSNYPDAVLLDDTSQVRDPYLALSHCWGGLIPYRTLQSNKAELCQRIEFTRLPRNFQDAFAVARWLSYRYIWIDSFCIVQDDAQDWLQQAVKMADVYSGAQLTISATRSSSYDEGFLTKRQTDLELPFSDRLPLGTAMYARDCDALETAHQGINGQPSDQTPLFQRAWAFQERLLSRRVLHFLRSEVILECEDSLWCECGEYDTYEWSEPDKAVYRKASWQTLVEKYTSRKLTYPNDVLPAISALARDFGIEGEYIAGLTKDDLYSNLLWRVKAPRDLDGELVSAPTPTRPSVYTAPSFSWASIIGRVEWVEPGATFQVVCKTENFATTLENRSDPFGRVTSGYVMLRGPVVEVNLRSMPKVFEGQLKGWLHPKGNREFTKKDVNAVFDTADIPPLSTVLKLVTIQEESSWYYRNNGLVLRPSTRTRGAYERIGCYWDASKEFFKDSTRQFITIV